MENLRLQNIMQPTIANPKFFITLNKVMLDKTPLSKHMLITRADASGTYFAILKIFTIS